MKKLKIIMMFLLMFALLPISNSSAYSGGLMDGKLVNTGAVVGEKVTSSALATDSDFSTSATIPALGHSSLMWIDLGVTATIKSYLLTTEYGNFTMYFLDSDKKQIFSKSNAYSTSQTIVNLATPIANVRYVYLNNFSEYSVNITEIDVFGDITSTPTPTPATTPTPTTTPSPTATPDPSATATATPTPTPSTTPEQTGDRAILTITLINGIEKEYDLPIAEVDAFLNWYDSATDSGKYGINKHNSNKGPFSKRTDYVIHDKILTFEVSEYTAQ